MFKPPSDTKLLILRINMATKTVIPGSAEHLATIDTKAAERNRQAQKEAAAKKRRERYDKAIVAGMNEGRANQYADFANNPTYNWLGRQTAMNKADIQVADDAMWNELMAAQYEENYNDPAAQVKRRQAAGLNDSLTGGEGISAGEASQIDDTVLSGSEKYVGNDILNFGSDPNVQAIFNMAGSLMQGATGVQTLIANGLGNELKRFNLDKAESDETFNIASKIGDLGNYIPQLGYSVKIQDGVPVYMDNHGNVVPTEIMSEALINDMLKSTTYFRNARYRSAFSNAVRTAFSPKNLNEYVKNIKDIGDTRKGMAEGEMAVSKLGYDHKSLYNLYGDRTSIFGDTTGTSYDDVATYAGEIALLGLEAERDQAKLMHDYWKEMAEGKNDSGFSVGKQKAINERYMAANSSIIEAAKNKALALMGNKIGELVRRAPYDVGARWQLMSIINPGYATQLGLGSPYAHIDKIVGGALDFSKNLAGAALK